MKVLKYRFLGLMMLLTAGIVVGQAAQARAALIVSDSFNTYSVGELNGQTGGTGLAGSWSANTTDSEVVDPGTPLSYNVGGIVHNGGNRAAQVSGSVNPVASRNLSVSQTGDLYFSFMVRFTGSLIPTDRFLLWGFGGTRNPSGTANPFGMGVAADNDAGSPDFVLRPDIAAAGGTVSGGGSVTVNATYFLVAKAVKNTGTGRYDQMSMWINPPSSSETAPTFTASFTDAATLVGTATSIRFRTASGTTYLMDELLVGNTWADVVPVPEPGSFAMLLCGMMVLFAIRKHR